jgi:hypothetical protein
LNFKKEQAHITQEEEEGLLLLVKSILTCLEADGPIGPRAVRLRGELELVARPSGE